jgi:hypothetical protein
VTRRPLSGQREILGASVNERWLSKGGRDDETPAMDDERESRRRPETSAFHAKRNSRDRINALPSRLGTSKLVVPKSTDILDNPPLFTPRRFASHERESA